MIDDNALHIQRTFHAPVEAVFDAWTSEEVLRRWWYTERGWETSEAEVDLRVGGVVRVAVKASDPAPKKANASGVKLVKVSFGDGTNGAVARRGVALHRYRRGGTFTILVSVTDGAGNVTLLKRRVSIQG